MTQLYDLTGVHGGWLASDAFLRLAQANQISDMTGSFTTQIVTFLPTLLGALLILGVGIILAFVASWLVSNLLKRTTLDDRLASWVSGRAAGEIPTAKWAGTGVFWLVMLITLVAVLDNLNLTVVSTPLNDLLSTILEYLPRIAGALVWLGVAWVIATLIKTAVVRGLSQFGLDERLSEQTGVAADGSLPNLSTTLAEVLYWFVFLLFLPLVLDTLAIEGLLTPVESLIGDFLSAIPRIIFAGLIFAGFWLGAKILSKIVTNLLAALGIDNFGQQFGLASGSDADGISLSGLTGTVIYSVGLLFGAIAALEKLDIEAISAPAIDMLNRIFLVLPQVALAIGALVIFFFIGKFVAEIVTNLFRGFGFDSILSTLGLPEPAVPPTVPPVMEGMPDTDVPDTRKTPSEVVGIITWVGILLFGVVVATQILDFPALTEIVSAILAISAQVLVGVIIFAIGLYAANLVYQLVRSSMGGGASNTVAQVARIVIIAFVGALALQQIGIAPSIVNLAFGLLLGAVAVAIAIAFGLGGRDVAAEQLRDWVDQLKR